MEYKKTRNQPMKDNDQLFKKRVRQSFAMGEVEVLSAEKTTVMRMGTARMAKRLREVANERR